jgi:hypothetical protein
MEPEGSLPSSQQPATGPYPEPDESVPHFQTYFPNIYCNIILTSTPMFSEWSLTFRLSDQNFFTPFSSPCARHTPPISFYLILFDLLFLHDLKLKMEDALNLNFCIIRTLILK